MPVRRLVLHSLRAMLALVLALLSPAYADSCGTPVSAVTSSQTTFGMAGMGFSFEQTAHLERVSGGGGVDGNWIVTEWTVVTTLPAADPYFAERGGMAPVPEWNATCSGKMLSPTRALSECKGKIPLVVQNNQIAWIKGGKPIGKITPAKSALPGEMTLNILPNAGGFDWTMTGTVIPAESPALSGELTDWHSISDPTLGTVGHAFTLQVTVSPALVKYIDAIDARVTGDGSGMLAAGIAPAGSTVVGRKFALTVSGASAKSRKATADASTIEATMDFAGCQVAESWPLTELIAAAGYAP